jgi:hypothetical protein
MKYWYFKVHSYAAAELFCNFRRGLNILKISRSQYVKSGTYIYNKHRWCVVSIRTSYSGGPSSKTCLAGQLWWLGFRGFRLPLQSNATIVLQNWPRPIKTNFPAHHLKNNSTFRCWITLGSWKSVLKLIKIVIHNLHATKVCPSAVYAYSYARWII